MVTFWQVAHSEDTGGDDAEWALLIEPALTEIAKRTDEPVRRLESWLIA